ncbi:hypothetical protein GCM10027258_27040 [Amycolatopsis stemonae]
MTTPAQLREEVKRLRAKLARQRRGDSTAALDLRRRIGDRLAALRDQGAEAWLRELAADQARVLGPRHGTTLESWYLVATCCSAAGRVDEALALFAEVRAALVYVRGADHDSVARCDAGAAAALLRAGRYAAAIEVYRTLGDGFRIAIAQLLVQLGRFDEAEQLLRQLPDGQPADFVRKTIQAELGAPGPLLRAAHELVDAAGDGGAGSAGQAWVAYAFLLSGRLEEAVSAAEKLLAARLAHPGPEDPATWDARLLLARALVETDRTADADHYARAALASAPWPPGHPQLVRALATVARVHFRRGEWADAVQAYEYAVEGFEEVLGAEHPETRKAVAGLGSAREAARG